ncbi:helix-turn-helix domain-containing protein [Acetohalobium arabaticum]|uniref:Transcriptional regulator, XRE family n=1 Tax=Acetohalobium arabaticum (strain ATCC 49924 / DSM 5501 / Z-7288) TaxID=574087 RepID=D9QQ59_ACEAZ|nr:XRE family transcriptional regulator [Acetohalobium arabaticum]ADL12650.1 transcriptional regulator, XRE family [Acetohalobium arabaticum DSM 5501]
MEDIDLNIGTKLHQIRKKKGYSLSKLEEVTEVSKSMLGQIERGTSNPTVKTLWKIAKGLNVSFSTFIEEESSEVSIVSPADTKPLIEDDSNYLVYPLFSFEQKKRFEIYNIELKPNHNHQAEAHFPGVEEYIIVSKGTLELIIAGQTYQVPTESTIHFPADKSHTYCNNTESIVKAYVLVYYPV